MLLRAVEWIDFSIPEAVWVTELRIYETVRGAHTCIRSRRF